MADDGERLLGHIERAVGGEAQFQSFEGMNLIVFSDRPRPGSLTVFTMGLSLTPTPGGGKERRELMLVVDSEDLSWAMALAETARQQRARCPFEPGDLLNFGAQVSAASPMSAFVVAPKPDLPEGMERVVLSRFPVVFRQLYPLHPEEYSFGQRVGGEALVEHYAASHRWTPADVRRPNLAGRPAAVHEEAVEALRPALRELLAGVATEDPRAKDQLCLTLTVSDDEDAWMQVTGGQVNLAYPHRSEPSAVLRERLGEAAGALTLEDWKPGVYATFVREPLALEPLVDLALRLFTRVLAVRAPDFTLDVEFQRIPR